MNTFTIGILLQASSGSSLIETPSILILVGLIIMGITIYSKRKNINSNKIKQDGLEVNKEGSINNFKQENSNSNSGQGFFIGLTFLLLIFIGIYIFPKGSKDEAYIFARSYIHGFLGDNEYYLSETIKCWDGTFCCKIVKNNSNDNNSLLLPDGYQLRIGFNGVLAGGYYFISIMPFTNDYNITQQGKHGFHIDNLNWPEKDNFLN